MTDMYGWISLCRPICTLTCGGVVPTDTGQRGEVYEGRAVMERTCDLKDNVKLHKRVVPLTRLHVIVHVKTLNSRRTLTGCSQTRGVWKENRCVQVSALESMRTGSGGAEPMLDGL